MNQCEACSPIKGRSFTEDICIVNENRPPKRVVDEISGEIASGTEKKISKKQQKSSKQKRNSIASEIYSFQLSRNNNYVVKCHAQAFHLHKPEFSSLCVRRDYAKLQNWKVDYCTAKVCTIGCA